MLSVKSLIDYLEVKQEKLLSDEKNIKLTKPLNKSFSYIFGDINNVEYYDIKFGKKTNINNFILKILFSLNNNIYFMKYDEQYNILTNFYKKIIIELDEKNLYYKFYYNLDRKMSRNNIQSIIYNLLHKDSKNVLVNEYSLIQYVIDYLGINLVCLFVDNDFNLIMDCHHDIYTSKRFGNKINRFIPIIIMLCHKGSYYNVVIGDNKVFKFSEHKNIINNCFRFFNINDDNVNMNNFTYSQIKEFFIENNGNIKKVSDKTNKLINKTKDDLVIELKYLLNKDYKY